MWMTIRAAVTLADSGGRPQILQTDQSIAAVVSGDLVDLLLALQQPMEPLPTAGSPLS